MAWTEDSAAVVLDADVRLNDADLAQAGSYAGATLTLAITRKDGSITRTQVRSRIDTDDERDMFAAGGLLPRIANELLAAKG